MYCSLSALLPVVIKPFLSIEVIVLPFNNNEPDINTDPDMTAAEELLLNGCITNGVG